MSRAKLLAASLAVNVLLVAVAGGWVLRRWRRAAEAPHGRPPAVLAREAHLRALDGARSGAQGGAGVDVVMLGDSLTQWAEWWELLDRPVANRGIAGDTVALVRGRMASLAALRPKVVFVMVGINDLLEGTSPDVLAVRHAALISELKALLPSARIVVQALLPVRDAFLAGDDERVTQATVARANALLAAGARDARVDWLDVGPRLSDASGQLAAGMTVDGVHLSAAAYRAWADAVRALLPR